MNSPTPDPPRLRPLTHADLPAIAAVHMRAFPKRAMSALGVDVVTRYYAWLLHETHTDAHRVGAWQGDRLVGFNFAGRFNGAMTGFLQRNRNFLIGRVARRPWLILTNGLFRSRLRMAVEILQRRAQTTPAAPEAIAKRQAYLRGFGILAIAVDPDMQGAGVGRLLMRDADDEALRRGVEMMNLSVAPDNLQAIAFYERIGWHRQMRDDGAWDGDMIKQL